MNPSVFYLPLKQSATKEELSTDDWLPTPNPLLTSIFTLISSPCLNIFHNVNLYTDCQSA